MFVDLVEGKHFRLSFEVIVNGSRWSIQRGSTNAAVMYTAQNLSFVWIAHRCRDRGTISRLTRLSSLARQMLDHVSPHRAR